MHPCTSSPLFRTSSTTPPWPTTSPSPRWWPRSRWSYCSDCSGSSRSRPHLAALVIVRHNIAALASDRRIQLLLIAFSFGAFIEGAAGFGTPIAISAAMLIGIGFRPLPAAGLSLIGNTAPVAFGAIGTPLTTWRP
jgi:L-lactate permease